MEQTIIIGSFTVKKQVNNALDAERYIDLLTYLSTETDKKKNKK
jgi:hypothetical protein